MISFKIGRKGTAFYPHSQIKCTKSTKMCTHWPICAMKISAKEQLIALLCPNQSLVAASIRLRAALMAASTLF